MPRRKHESLGELISTVVFFGVAVTLFVAAIESFDMGSTLKGFGFTLAGTLCFLGGLRFPIARLSDRLKKQRKKNGH